MILGRVVGNVVATAHHPAYDGLKLLWVEPVGPDGKPESEAPLLAVDRAGAGPGDRVLVLREGGGVRQIFAPTQPFPVLETIVAIVDEVEVDR